MAIIIIFVGIFTKPIHISSGELENQIQIVKVQNINIDKSTLNILQEEIKEKSNPKYTEDELYWLAKIVNAEAPDDTDEGQQAVANVVINRVNNSEFPDSIYKVIWQKTGRLYQFSPCQDGGIKREPDERAIKNAKVVLEGERLLPEDVLYFYMPTSGNKKDWIRSRKVYKKIGVHRFCY